MLAGCFWSGYEKAKCKMKQIAIQKSKSAVLPEIEIYKQYFTEYEFIDFYDVHELSGENIDLIWRFMGTDFKKINIPVIHEYASLSLPPFGGIKDFVKKKFNVKPGLRVFLNQHIASKYDFSDAVPFCYRDMGVSKDFFRRSCGNGKLYDFVYVGSMSKDREIFRLLNHLKKDGKAGILLVGQPPDDLYNAYKKYSNIVFSGKVPYKDVPDLVMKAEYAVNYIPNKYPFNIQTSTKLLEYAAMGMKIVTTSYGWVNRFEAERGMRFFHLHEDCSNLSLEALESFSFKTNDISDLQWENILDNSGLREAIACII